MNISSIFQDKPSFKGRKLSVDLFTQFGVQKEQLTGVATKFHNNFIAIFSCNPKNQNTNVLKTSTNNKDAIKKTAVFYENTNEEVLEFL